MPGKFEKFRKIRSLDEVLTRGSQAISAFREQRKGGAAVPGDEEFIRLVDRAEFGAAPVIAETLWSRFFRNGSEKFFPSFRDQHATIAAFRARFAQKEVRRIVSCADAILEGRVDLLGLKGLYVGTEIDWHREPVSSKRSPLKHWKEFDELDSSETGNKKIVWELNRHQHFFTLGTAYWLTGDERFARAFASQLSTWIDDNPPGLGINWASSLEVAFRSISWLWAFHLFRESESFTPSLFHRALKFLYLHGRHVERYLSKYYSPNTHLTGEALGLYYLGTQLPFLERSAQWRKLGEDILFSEIEKQVHTDGVYFEQSTWYQRYTADFFAHFVILRSLWGGGESHPAAAQLESRLERSFDFLMHVTQPDGTTPLIGDDDGGRMLPLTGCAADDFRGTLALSAVIFERGDHKFVSKSASQELLWLMGPDSLVFFDALAEHEPSADSADFSRGGYCIMRDGWAETDNCLIVDCGDVGSLAGGHGHADSLSVEVTVHGTPFLVDSGTYTYHETRDLRDYFRSTAAHNTLEIDGRSSSDHGGPFGWQTKAECRRTSWISTERFDLFEGVHDGYSRLASPAHHRRSILFLKNDYWIIHDLIETGGKHDYALNFHFDSRVRARIDAAANFVEADGHRMFTFGDFGEWEQKESWISKNHGKRENAPFLRYLAKGIGPQEFFTFILPAAPGEPATVSEIPVITGRGFEIRYAGYVDTLYVNDDRTQLVRTENFDSGFRYSWARTVEGLPDEFVLVDGGGLVVAGNPVLGARAEEFAEIRRLGSTLNIKTAAGISTAELRLVDRRVGDRRGTGSDRRKARQ